MQNFVGIPADLHVEEVQELVGVQFAQKHLVLFCPSGSTLVLKAAETAWM